MTRFDTEVDGIQASGMVLKDVHHGTFIPKPTTLDPALPSGSLWLRPYDGQMEMLTYQGSSGILEVSNGQGFVSFSTSAVNSLSTSVPTIAEFNFAEIQEGQFISSAATYPGPSFDFSEFTIHVKGLYRINYLLTAFNDSGGGPTDGTAQGLIRVNGSVLSNSRTTNYFESGGNDGATTCAASMMVILDIGDVVEFELSILVSGGTMTYEPSVSFELIRPEV